MCGIAGILDLTPNKHSREIIKKMTAVLEHRGPDDDGFFSDGPVHLGFRRLAILDLSRAGHQPMSSKDGSRWIVFNGEVYNYRELRSELQQLGHTFISSSDTEVILAAHEQWGEECVKRFNGMWAFAIWEKKKKQLFCSRDRFGVKPFYYYTSGTEFIFGSEIKALLVHPHVPRHPNLHRVYDYLAYGYLDHTPQTFFEGINQLPPAHSLTLTDDGSIRIRRYWDLEIGKETLLQNDEEYAGKFLSLFQDSIRLRLRSDVPVGTCLSGGLDSSSIVCVVNDIFQKEKITNIGDHQNTFSAAYEEKEVDEREYSQAVIEKTGASSHLIFPSAQDVLTDLDQVVYHQDEPFGSTSIFAQWYVMKRARQAGMKVMLDGQGADELLAGYYGYFGPYLASLLRSFHLIRLPHEFLAWKKNHGGNYALLLRQAMTGIVMKLMPRLLSSFIISTGRADGSIFLSEEFMKKYAAPPSRLTKSYRDPLQNELHRVLLTGLPALLHYEDRNSMAWSIEARVPFLDYRLVEYVFSLPNEQKINNGTTKIVLRNAMKSILPEKVRLRQSKLGFATPEAVWLKKDFQAVIQSTFTSSQFNDRGIFQKDKPLQLFKNEMQGRAHRLIQSPTIWRWFNLELWFRKFID